MVRKLLILIAAVLVIGCAVCIFNRKGSASPENSVTPILDSSVDRSLHLDHSDVVNQLPAYCTTVDEWWSGSKGQVSIMRWYFDDPKKMDDFFKPSSKLLLPEILSWNAPLKWINDPDISDKTCWGSSYAVIFIKGKNIIRVSLNSRMSDEQKKEYTKKIAKSIAKKL